MKNIFKEDLTVFRLLLIIMFFGAIIILVVIYYGGYFKDAITKNTCPLVGEEYQKGNKSGDGKCIIPAGTFDY